MNPQIGFLLNKSLESLRNSSFESAELYLKQVIRLQSNNPHALRLLGVLAAQKKQYSEAIRFLETSLRYLPNNSLAWSNLGNIYLEQKEFLKALNAYEKSLKIDPLYAEAWSNKGNALFALGRYEEALNHHYQAINLNPDYAQAYSNAGNVLNHLKRFEESIVYYKKAIQLNPNYPEAYFNFGNALNKLRRFHEAIICYESSLGLNPNSAETHCNLGVTYNHIHQFSDACAEFEKALALNPEYAEAYSNMGGTAVELRQFERAIFNYEKAMKLKPEIDWLQGDYIYSNLKIGRWINLNLAIDAIPEGISLKRKVIQPFALLAISDSPQLQKTAAEIYASEKYPPLPVLGDISLYPKHEKIRIGYFSPDFRTHPVSFLTAELFEKHDREKFEIIAFSLFAAPEIDEMRIRIKNTFDMFIDAENMSDLEVAQLARKLEIDIAVDLSGPTQHSRVQIMSYRVAPVQVNWLGFPGTFGASFIDYILADKIVIPPEDRDCYVEKVAYLPMTYMVDDSNRVPSNKLFTRQEFGLPENKFVFCCFNNDYKFNENMLNSWANILLQVPGSVIWISENNTLFRENILNEFEQRGVQSPRIIFAKRLDLMSDHLARYSLADIFLDTFPYNAHTTAVDSLKAGVPIITLIGNSFVSRVAASLLSSAGLPSLIAHSKEEYESLAVKLANDSQQLDKYKRMLLKKRQNRALFNPTDFARALESAFFKMYDHHHAGYAPEHLHIEIPL